MEKLLPEICTIQYGFPFDSSKFSDTDGVPLIRIRDVVRGYSQTFTTEEYKKEYLVYEGDLLIGMDGEFNIAKWGNIPALLNQRVCRLIPTSEVDKDYLFYFMPNALKRIEQKTPFVTVKHLSARELNKVRVPLPPMEEQRKIAAVLDKISDLIAKRRTQLDKLDLLAKAGFVEMFGDPVTNQYNLPTVEFGSVLTVKPQNGLYKPQSDYILNGEGTPILRIDGFYNGRVNDFTKLKRLRCSDEELQHYLLRENDIVINRVNSIEYLGKCGLIRGMTESTVYESNMMRLHVDESKFNVRYVVQLLCSQFVYNQILSKAKKSVNQASINQKDVQSLMVYMPSIELQNKFAAFAEQVENMKSGINVSLLKLRTLKKALMQEYFS